MDYKVEWVEPSKLVVFTLDGAVTMSDYQRFADERTHYLDTATQPLYVICDWQRVDEKLTPEIFKAMAASQSHRHPNCAVMASVGNQTILKLLTTMIKQKSQSGDSAPASTQVFSTREEAEQFCRDVDNVRKKLAGEA